MLEREVASLSEFIEAVFEVNNTWYNNDPYPEIWYRGVNDASHLLLPGAYWRERCDEVSLYLSFRALSPMLLPGEPRDEWDWYYTAQHYGMPTRLLDWTESPLQALHFALTRDASKRTPCVWIVDPVALNQTAHGAYWKTILVPGGGDPERKIDAWLPTHLNRKSPVRTPGGLSTELPIAIYPNRSNSRIFAQRGVFTVHGSLDIPLDALGVRSPRGLPRLGRILVRRQSRRRILRQLFLLGFNETATYPEPPSVSRDLLRSYRVK